jgi:2-oxo-3-hexenedioate decarboxylase
MSAASGPKASGIDAQAFGKRLDDAARRARAVPQFTGAESFDLDTAYAIQRASIESRLARGERIVGVKMGFTSRAKALQMGVSDLICGRLTDAMLVEDGGTIDPARFVHPRVEPEVAFLLRRAIGPRETPMQALDAVAAIAPALEIIDSRYEAFRFSLTDVVADNSSASAFVVGAWSQRQLDVANLGLIVTFDGRIESVGSTAAILGAPLRSLCAAGRLAHRYGLPLEAGSIVLAGGATAASALHAGLHVALEVEGLGRCAFNVGRTKAAPV